MNTEPNLNEELIRCQSLVYFAENYLRIQDKQGNKYPLDNASMEMLKMIDEARKHGGHVNRVWMRTGCKWIITKE